MGTGRSGLVVQYWIGYIHDHQWPMTTREKVMEAGFPKSGSLPIAGQLMHKDSSPSEFTQTLSKPQCSVSDRIRRRIYTKVTFPDAIHPNDIHRPHQRMKLCSSIILSCLMIARVVIVNQLYTRKSNSIIAPPLWDNLTSHILTNRATHAMSSC